MNLSSSSSGKYLIHLAIEDGASVDEINHLIESYPWSCRSADNDNRYLPLHTAIKCHASYEIIQSLLLAYPEACTRADKFGNLPLHLAYQYKVPSDSIKNIIIGYPEACWIGNEDNNLPLHIACMSQLSMESVEFILDSYPEACTMKNRLGQLPLHKAVECSTPIDVIVALIDRFADGCLAMDDNGCLPIHIATCHPTSLDVISVLTKAYLPGCIVRATGMENSLPIHLAVENKASLDIIHVLINAFKEGCKAKNSSNRLPLHLAAIESYEGVTEIIDLLIQTYPVGCWERDSLGGFPLYYALFMKASSEVILMLLESSPEYRVDDDLRCLHTALVKEASTEVIVRLMEVFPEVCMELDDDGNLPIHLAIHYKASDNVILLLIDQYPTCCYHTDINQDLPLHLAVKANRSINVILGLLSVHLNACEILSGSGDLPLHLALKSKCSSDVISALVRAFPSTCSIKNNDSDYPLHIALGTHCTPDDLGPFSQNVYKLILKEYEDICKIESGSKGLLPLHIAVFNNHNEVIISLLLSLYPEAVKQKSKKLKGYALHYACMNEYPSSRIIEILSDAYPEANLESDIYGKLPLHLSLKKITSVKVLETLLKTHPTASRERDLDGNLPLHIALECQASDDIVLALLGTYLSSAKEKTRNGSLPIHLAANVAISTEVLGIVLRFFPDGIELRDSSGDLPIHIALRHNMCEEAVIYIINEFPDMCKVLGKNSDTPMEIALTLKRSTAIISAIITAYSDSVVEEYKDGSLPIHLAIRNHSSVDTIKVLVNGYRDIISQPTWLGTDGHSYPLHLAVRAKESLNVIKFLIEVNPQICIKKNSRGLTSLEEAIEDDIPSDIILTLLKAHPITSHGYLIPDMKTDSSDKDLKILPLHRALMKKSSTEVILVLIQSFPKACNISYRGSWPLHIALSEQASSDVILAILRVSIDVVNYYDSDGRLPIHLAIMNHASFKVISMLVLASPNSCKYLDKTEDSLSPFDYAIKIKSTPEVIKFIVLNDLPIDMDGSQPENYIHVYSWTTFLDVSHPNAPCLEISDMIDFVKFIFESFSVSSIKELCDTMDRKDRKAVNITDDRIKEIMYQYLFFCGRFKISESAPLHTSTTSMVVLADDYSVFEEYRLVYDNYCLVYGVPDMRYEGYEKSIRAISNQTNRPIPGNDVLRKEFDRFDKLGAGALLKEQFEALCKHYFGDSRRVVLKLMSRRDQYFREKRFRGRNSVRRLKAEYVVPMLKEPEMNQLAEALKSYSVEGIPLDKYKFCLVMPAGDRSLDSIYRHEELSHHLDDVIRVMENLLDSLLHLHDQGVIHGDVKLSNVVRLQSRIHLIDFDASTRIMDAKNVVMNKNDSNSISYLGVKFSSGILPPEMFYELKTSQEIDRYEKYWKRRIDGDMDIDTDSDVGIDKDRDKDREDSSRNTNLGKNIKDIDKTSGKGGSNSILKKNKSKSTRRVKLLVEEEEEETLMNKSLWERIKPYHDESTKKYYVVKTYDIDEQTGAIRSPDSLPYELLQSDSYTSKIDSWMIGILLFHILAKKSFITVDKDDHIDRDHTRTTFALLKSSSSSDRIAKKIESSLSQDSANPIPSYFKELLKKLLEPFPDKRISLQQAKDFLMKSLASHNFLSNGIRGVSLSNRSIRMQKKLSSIISEGKGMLGQLKETSKLIRKKTVMIPRIPSELLDKIGQAQLYYQIITKVNVASSSDHYTPRAIESSPSRSHYITSSPSRVPHPASFDPIPHCFLVVNQMLQPFSDDNDGDLYLRPSRVLFGTTIQKVMNTEDMKDKENMESMDTNENSSYRLHSYQRWITKLSALMQSLHRKSSLTSSSAITPNSQSPSISPSPSPLKPIANNKRVSFPVDENDPPNDSNLSLVFSETIHKNDVDDSSQSTDQIITDICSNEPILYLYLIDEVTMEPIVSDDDPFYPITIKHPSEFFPKALPLLYMGLKAIRSHHSVEKISRMLGNPIFFRSVHTNATSISSVSNEDRLKIESLIGNMDEIHALADFHKLQQAVENWYAYQTVNGIYSPRTSKRIGNRGSHSLFKELESLLYHHDRQCTFSSMNRVLTSNGRIGSFWTSSKHCERLLDTSNKGEGIRIDGSHFHAHTYTERIVASTNTWVQSVKRDLLLFLKQLGKLLYVAIMALSILVTVVLILDYYSLFQYLIYRHDL